MDSYIGQIILFAGNFAIRNFAFCDGTLLPIASNTALFSILGTTYGGNGKTTFALPNLGGRFAIGQGHGAGLPTYFLGESGGNVQTKLTATNIPSHTHAFSLRGSNGEGATDSPIQAFPATLDEDYYQSVANGTMGGASTDVIGQGGAFSIQNPFLALSYQICTVGLYPPRT